ncbi:MAG: hypothetical protein ABIA66_03010, partial [Candidatus Omnitrophota bacterium]
SMICGFIFIERKRPLNISIFTFLILFSSTVISCNSKGTLLTLWSPYQKLDLKEFDARGRAVTVNNALYMRLLDLSRTFISSHPELFGENTEYVKFGSYEIPYLFQDKPEDVLIVGSGGGNDVAGALRRGIKNIDAVELDPGIYKLGLAYHPEGPYKDSRVRVYIDDARSFFKKSKKQYDVISFGFLDSQSVSSSYNNIRPDHYIYTLESLIEAKALLKNKGVITISFLNIGEWVTIRLRGLLKETFKQEPLVFRVGFQGLQRNQSGFLMFVISRDMDALKERIEKRPELMEYIEGHRVNLDNKFVRLTTDDWPYLYHPNSRIPNTYLCIILSLLVLFLITGRAVFFKEKKLDFHFFFLGAAFMLLEFQNISKTTLLFGSTWLVNTYTITAILLLILLANLYAYHFKIKSIKPFYLLLCLSVLSLYVIPLGALNIPNYYLKASIIVIFLNLPIFFAGIIFINSFKKSPAKNIALGSNLLGASLGGLCESFSFIWGIKSLLILVLVFYIISYLAGRNLIFSKD